jgi:hypothetical protein
MRLGFVQTLCILAIALGAGLFGFGRHLDPPIDPQNPAAIRYDEGAHFVASMACGLGIGLITGGALGLVIPWVNAALARRYGNETPALTRGPTPSL